MGKNPDLSSEVKLMKTNWNIIVGFCLGSFAGVIYMKAIEFFPDDTHQGWACVVLYLFVCGFTAAITMEKS